MLIFLQSQAAICAKCYAVRVMLSDLLLDNFAGSNSWILKTITRSAGGLRECLYFFTFNVLALIATITVLRLIKIAPAAGLNNSPLLYNTPAASGKATIL